METVGAGASAMAPSSAPIRREATFAPIDSEEDLIALNGKAASKEFVNQTIDYMGQICGRTAENGNDVGYAVIDLFATRHFWTICTWTGSSGSGTEKFCLCKYTAFLKLLEEVIRFSYPSWTEVNNKNFIVKKVLGNSGTRFKRDQQLKTPHSRAFTKRNQPGGNEEEDHNDDSMSDNGNST